VTPLRLDFVPAGVPVVSKRATELLGMPVVNLAADVQLTASRGALCYDFFFFPTIIAVRLALLGYLRTCFGTDINTGAARRLIEQGGLYMNNQRILDLRRVIQKEDIENQALLLSRGKQRRVLVRITA
jgi:hypothetical protein